MSQRNRAWRRLQDFRIEKKAFIKLKNHSFACDFAENKTKENQRLLENAKYRKNNMCNCSCFMCGNPRFHWKQVTIQELKALDNFRSQEF